MIDNTKTTKSRTGLRRTLTGASLALTMVVAGTAASPAASAHSFSAGSGVGSCSGVATRLAMGLDVARGTCLLASATVHFRWNDAAGTPGIRQSGWVSGIAQARGGTSMIVQRIAGLHTGSSSVIISM
jgi:hypothetical protein